MTAVAVPALDSAEWGFDQFETEIFESTNFGDEHEDIREDWRRAAIALFAEELTAYWASRGHEVTLVSAAEYGRMTDNDEAINETASSYHLPDEGEALRIWEDVAVLIDLHRVQVKAGYRTERHPASVAYRAARERLATN